MKSINQHSTFLKDQMFSNSLSLNLKGTSKISFYRDDYILELTKGKKVIHMGFVDHTPIIEKKIKQGAWLHDKLYKNCQLCIGIDINKEGILEIKKKFGYDNLYAMDIVNDNLPDEIQKEEVDYVLIPDVIEHIGNTITFMKAINLKFPNARRFILTTPNAFRIKNFINTLLNKELINSDHRYWFTPYTLAKISFDSGFKVEDLNFCEHSKLSRRKIITKIFLKLKKPFRNCLVIELSREK